ncbi:hypothetical protein K501DRAFT_166477 [Backusella circina FSU 941]|nr:hypothetical protein K501DRAFT_166564 [Backusella circina FSU 941]KAI8891316.1 hypothetical protein K501DRAFT_166477 [Backusella circina FSU 941]
MQLRNRQSRSVQWVYAIGSAWIPFDSITQSHIEQLWKSNASDWIPSANYNFYGPVYIDIPHLWLLHHGIAYTIARRTI